MVVRDNKLIDSSEMLNIDLMRIILPCNHWWWIITHAASEMKLIRLVSPAYNNWMSNLSFLKKHNVCIFVCFPRLRHEWPINPYLYGRCCWCCCCCMTTVGMWSTITTGIMQSRHMAMNSINYNDLKPASRLAYIKNPALCRSRKETEHIAATGEHNYPHNNPFRLLAG